MSTDGQLLGELTIAQDLDAVGTTLEQTALTQSSLVDRGAGSETLEISDGEGNGLDRERKPRFGKRR